MEWYRVTKNIHGRKYLYWQKTYRAGGSVRTLNKYIGPASGAVALGTTKAPDRAYHYTPEQIAGIKELGRLMDTPDDAYFYSDKDIAEMKKLGAIMDAPDGPAFEPEVLSKAERAEDERTQYGSRAARVRKQKAAHRAAKKKTRGTKSVNPFMAQAIKKKKPFATCYLCGKDTPSLNDASLCTECAQ